MGFLTVSTIFSLCLATSLATYGHDYKNHGARSHGGHGGGGKVKIDEPKIHLDSAKIILDRPSINVHGSSHGIAHGIVHGGGHGIAHGIAHGPVIDEEPIILENEKQLYIRKSLHGIHSASAPIYLDGGYSSGKVLDIAAPIQVINHAPIVQERPILIRRPVVVSKGLISTQDHLERLHYGHTSGIAGHSLGGYAIPISKGLHERTVVYGGLGHDLGHGYGLGHGIGLGHGLVSSYSAPLIIDQQPKAIIGHADVGIASGKALGGAYLHGGSIHGGSLYGGSLHGGSLHGGSLHGGSIYGGSLHGEILHGGKSSHGSDLKKY